MAPVIINCGSTRIAYILINEGARGTRRERERQACALCLQALLGPDAKLDHGPNGQPLVEGWHVSVSHSQRLAAVALDPLRHIGIDAEEWREALMRVRDKFVCAAESIADERLLHAWTAKEAIYKAADMPNLVLSQIVLDPDLATGRAGDKLFGLHHLWIDQTLVAVANRE